MEHFHLQYQYINLNDFHTIGLNMVLKDLFQLRDICNAIIVSYFNFIGIAKTF